MTLCVFAVTSGSHWRLEQSDLQARFVCTVGEKRTKVKVR